jgi:hypothetical protein
MADLQGSGGSQQFLWVRNRKRLASDRQWEDLAWQNARTPGARGRQGRHSGQQEPAAALVAGSTVQRTRWESTGRIVSKHCGPCPRALPCPQKPQPSNDSHLQCRRDAAPSTPLPSSCFTKSTTSAASTASKDDNASWKRQRCRPLAACRAASVDVSRPGPAPIDVEPPSLPSPPCSRLRGTTTTPLPSPSPSTASRYPSSWHVHLSHHA